MDDVKEEIKARIAIEDLVSEYVELKRAGRSLKGLSPWTNERTPSFMVSPEKGIWHDFSSNKGGDIFTFLMMVEGISFREALDKLAAKAGIEVKKYSSGDRQLAEHKARLMECLRVACHFFQVHLTRNKEIINYVFYKRGLNRKVVAEFKVGYAPSGGRDLTDFLTKKGFRKREIEDAGLFNRFGSDLFRARVMIPLMDQFGNVIGFTGRVVDEKDKKSPKYLNTPETLLYNKSRHVFGLSQARESILKNKFVVLVEGNMDVISSHQAGVKEAVATAGTAMTDMHLKGIAKLCTDIRLAYDGDSAGVAAAERAVRIAVELGISLSVIDDYDGAKDADELIQRDPALWRKAVSRNVPGMDWILGKFLERVDIKTGAGAREFSTLAMKLIHKIADPVEREFYLRRVSEILGVSEEILEEKEGKLAAGIRARRLKKIKGTSGVSSLDTVEAGGSDRVSPDSEDSEDEEEISRFLVEGSRLMQKIERLMALLVAKRVNSGAEVAHEEVRAELVAILEECKGLRVEDWAEEVDFAFPGLKLEQIEMIAGEKYAGLSEGDVDFEVRDFVKGYA